MWYPKRSYTFLASAQLPRLSCFHRHTSPHRMRTSRDTGLPDDRDTKLLLVCWKCEIEHCALPALRLMAGHCSKLQAGRGSYDPLIELFRVPLSDTGTLPLRGWRRRFRSPEPQNTHEERRTTSKKHHSTCQAAVKPQTTTENHKK